jgi:DMSO/TMAO reductase YedYZ molybdopterin-dependent catalytic subunit
MLLKTPKPRSLLTRRETLLRLVAGAGALSLAGCDFDSRDPDVLGIVDSAENLTRSVQRALLAPREALAPEYSKQDISTYFKPNGSTAPDDPEYLDAVANDFADWKLEVGGLVENPLKLSLADLRALPARTQITRHDCVEGWSCIGEWTGVPLMSVLASARLKPQARFIVFYCADQLEQTLDGTGQYYESIDLIDAAHPQTILAYAMNGAPLPVDHGAPLRLRVERQLGYKMAKYVMKIEALDSFAALGLGQGGFWEDRGYEWYAGI